MNTIKIRKEHPELITRIRSNVIAFKNFTQDTFEGDEGKSLYGILIDNNYYDFLINCFNDDIEELQKIIEDERSKCLN